MHSRQFVGNSMEEQTSNSRGKNDCETKSLLLSDLSYLLILRDQMGSDLRQATALMLVTENDEFVQCDPHVLQDYLYVLIHIYRVYQNV